MRTTVWKVVPIIMAVWGKTMGWLLQGMCYFPSHPPTRLKTNWLHPSTLFSLLWTFPLKKIVHMRGKNLQMMSWLQLLWKLMARKSRRYSFFHGDEFWVPWGRVSQFWKLFANTEYSLVLKRWCAQNTNKRPFYSSTEGGCHSFACALLKGEGVKQGR